MKNKIKFIIITAMCTALLITAGSAAAKGNDVSVRIKDLAVIQGNNVNQLVGYGLVTGLKGTGDKTKVLSNEMLNNMFQNLGLKIDPKQLQRLQTKNTAVVMITAHLPASFRSGDTIDVTVSSAGDATNLTGGVLILSTLRGPDGKVYASAQGPLSVGVEAGGNPRRSKMLVGRIPNGGIICRNMDANLVRLGRMTWVLKHPDFKTATRIADAINRRFHTRVAHAKNDRFVVIDADSCGNDPSAIAAKIGDIRIKPDTRARVVVNERTGTVVMGANVKILPVMISHGNLTLNVQDPKKKKAKEEAGLNPDPEDGIQRNRLVQMGGEATVKDVIDVLNRIGAKPKDLITILQALKNAGALQGELEVI